MSADGDSDREVEAIMQVAGGRGSPEGRGSPIASYGSGEGVESLGASYGSSRSESSLIGCGSSGRGDRPPSSYGSMKSDDVAEEENEDFKPPPSVVVTVSKTRVQIHRADSPETTFTEATNTLTCQSNVPREGVYINELSRDKNAEVIKEQQEEEEEEEEEQMRGGDEEEPQAPPSPPPSPPAPPSEGLGLQYGPTHPELSLPFLFKTLQSVLSRLSVMELTWFKRSVAQRHRGQVSQANQELLMECDVLGVVDFLFEHFGRGGGVKLAVTTLHLIDRRPPADELEVICKRVLLRHELQEQHKRHFATVFEGVARPGEQAGLERVFSEPWVAEGGHRGVNPEHEVLRQVQPAYGEPRHTLRLNDVFRPAPGEQGAGPGAGPRVVVLSGIPLAGLTFATHKLALDWSKEAANQDLHFLFYLSCHELRHYADERMSLLRLLAVFHHGVEAELPLLRRPDTPSALLLEGWEELRPPADFSAPPVTDAAQEAELKAVLASLVRGDMFPHMRLLITCRRSNLRLIPNACVHRLLELRGFAPPQRDLYFRSHCRDPSLGPRMEAQVKRSPVLYAMSHVPIFAWIVTFVQERQLRYKPSSERRRPHATVLYVHLLTVLLRRWLDRCVGGAEAPRWRDSDKTMLLSAGRLALRLTEARRTRFHDDDLREHGLDGRDLAAVGLVTEELPEWRAGPEGGAGAVGGATYVFIHLTLQEFMAAFYAYLAFRCDGRNAFGGSALSKVLKERPLLELLRPATERALASPDGHLDLLLRFLFGLALDSTEEHLRGTMLPHRHPPPRGTHELHDFLRGKMRDGTASPERRQNLQHCLDEITELLETD